jgi:hypothetical protein
VQLIKRCPLSNWHILLDEPISDVQRKLADDWQTCAIGERICRDGLNFQTPEQLTFEAKLLGMDFAIAINKKNKKRAHKVLQMIESVPFVFKNK